MSELDLIFTMRYTHQLQPEPAHKIHERYFPMELLSTNHRIETTQLTGTANQLP